MAAQTSTGIRLVQNHVTGLWELTGPGLNDMGFGSAHTLDSIAQFAGLGSGYWLRSGDYADQTRWTWVAL